MELLGDMGHMESQLFLFGDYVSVGHVESHLFLFGDSINIAARLVHGLLHTYHRLRNHFGRT
jgi:hypothetical protein